MIVEVKVPSPGESITEVEIATWLVKTGDFVEMDAELAEVNSDKATLTINAPNAGVITILVEAGQVAVGQVVASINSEGAAATATPAQQTAAPVAPATPPASQTATPKTENYATGTPSASADKLMKEQGIDPASVQGTGRDGRVTKADVVTAPKTPAAPVAAPAVAPAVAAAPAVIGARTERREKMTTLRKKIAQRLVSVKNETAMLTTFNEVDLFNVMEMRKQYKDKFKEVNGVNLGFMSFFTKAACMALMEFPAVNARIDGGDIVYNDFVDMGVAVSTERGLVVPNIRNAHLLDLAGIEKAIMAYALKARENKISIDDMTGGTFTITNGGVFGSMLSTPILNPPQSGILGMHNIVERPVAIKGEVKIRPIMYLALSYDHRIIDGKEAVSFLVRIKERLEDPTRLLLNL